MSGERVFVLEPRMRPQRDNCVFQPIDDGALETEAAKSSTERFRFIGAKGETELTRIAVLLGGADLGNAVLHVQVKSLIKDEHMAGDLPPAQHR